MALMYLPAVATFLSLALASLNPRVSLPTPVVMVTCAPVRSVFPSYTLVADRLTVLGVMVNAPSR